MYKHPANIIGSEQEPCGDQCKIVTQHLNNVVSCHSFGVWSSQSSKKDTRSIHFFSIQAQAFDLVLCNKPIYRIGFVKELQNRF